MLQTNSSVSHYRILEKIGEGGMGEVFLAEDTRLGRRVAIKILPAKISADTHGLERFKQEARAASALNHPNIITIYDIGEIDGKHFIAAEYIEGDALRGRMKKRLTFDETLSILIQTAEALSAAHEVGIIHRDIKPENIMIRPDGYVKVVDFGLAKLSESKAKNISEPEDSTKKLVKTNPGMVMGTAAYMSPEQARGLKLDHRTDIFSFGVLLYEMLARRAPFTGETSTDVMLSIIQREPPALSHIAPDLPQELYFIVSKLLRKKLDERYQSIKDALADLRRLKQRLDYEEIERTLSPEDSKARLRREEKDTAILEELNKIKEQQYVSSYYFAVVYSGLNEKDQAFAYLEKAYTERSDALTSIKVNPWFENLRSDTRFQDLLRRMNLPE